MVDVLSIGTKGMVRIIAGVDGERRFVRLTGMITEIKENTAGGIFLCKTMETPHKVETYWIETCVSIRGQEYGWIEPLEKQQDPTISHSEIAAILEDACMACAAYDNQKFAQLQQRIFAHIPRYVTDQPPDKGGTYQRMVLIRDIITDFADTHAYSHPALWFAKVIHDYLSV